MMTRKARFFATAAAFLALAPNVWSQRYSDWRVYRASDGMAESACVSVSVGINGNVLVKHLDADSISELDGYSIRSFQSPEVSRNRICEGASGELWTAVAAGVEEFRDHQWILHPIPEFETTHDALMQSFQQVLSGDEDAKTALDAAAAVWQEQIDAAKS